MSCPAKKKPRKIPPTVPWLTFITELQACEKAAYDLGLTMTARAINTATKDAGWERAAQLESEAP